MVVSLESQNVRVKKPFYNDRKALYINLKPLLFFNFIKEKITLKIAIVLLSLALILTTLSAKVLTPAISKSVNLELISLPYHSAEVSILKDINNYKSNQRYKLYQTHQYSSNETLSALSIKYGVSIDTILHVNGIKDIRQLKDNQNLRIPKTNGIIHIVSNKDTLGSLFDKYTVPVKEIFRVNKLKSETLLEGTEIFIPGLDPRDWGHDSDIKNYFIYPLRGYITKRFGSYTNNITGLTSKYEGLDFTSEENSNVYSSKSGVVSMVGYSANYGNYVFIDHQGGLRTLYAHLNTIKVSNRDKVTQKTVIGELGNSGYVNTKKLFFCILENNEPVNPESILY